MIIVLYSFFDQYLANGKVGGYLRMQANLSQLPRESKETNGTSQQSTGSTGSNSSTSNYTSSNYSSSYTSSKRKETSYENTQEPQSPTVSPYIEKVKISRLHPASYYRPSLITLIIRPYKGEEINITGWKIKTRHGEFTIPKGIEKYESHRTPKNIIIKDYVTVYLIGSKNPLGLNRDFRANKCFGYIKKYRDFYPSFYASCPRLKLEDLSHLNPYCQEFILHLSTCEIPDYSNNIKIATDSKCVSFIRDNFSYSSCFKKYSQDENFLLNYWYIYIKGNIVEELHDTVYLYDQYGLLVDKYSY